MTISRSHAALAFLGSTALPAIPAHAAIQPSEPGYSSDQPRQDTSEDSGDEIIVVTGSHIRGAAIASPVITVGRDSIDKAGQNDLGEVVRSIPQNFCGGQNPGIGTKSEEHTSELQSLMRISYAVFCLKKKTN